MSEVIPKLNGKFTNMVFCVPTPNMLDMDLTYHLEKVTKYNDIKNVIKQVSEGLLKGILGYTENLHVSCDFNNDTYSSTFDSGAVIVLGDHFVKLMS